MRKRAPYPCNSSSSCQADQNEKKPRTASEQDEKYQRSQPAQNQSTTTRPTLRQPQVSEESWAGEGYVEQERCSPRHASWITLSPAGETGRETPSREAQSSTSMPLPLPGP